MPGRNIGRYTQSGFALLLPAAAFEPRRISAPERFPRPPYPEPALRNGVSLAPVAVPFRAPPRGVAAPRLLLQHNPESRLPARSVRHSRPRSAFALLARGRSTSRSRCRTPIRNSLAALQPALTLGTASLGINVPADTSLGGSPSPSTRSPFAPRCRLCFIIASFGSSFPVRCRLRGLLFLLTSWNLLHNAPETLRSQYDVRVKEMFFLRSNYS
jgi:hypothetical protein